MGKRLAPSWVAAPSWRWAPSWELEWPGVAVVKSAERECPHFVRPMVSLELELGGEQREVAWHWRWYHGG